MLIAKIWAYVNLKTDQPNLAYRIGGKNSTQASHLGAQSLDMSVDEAYVKGWRAKKVEVHLPDNKRSSAYYFAIVTRSATKALSGLPGEVDRKNFYSRENGVTYIIVASQRDVVGRLFDDYDADQENPPSPALLDAVKASLRTAP